MTPGPGGPGLRGKLLLAHLVVIAVAVGALFLATLAIAPTLFDRAMGGMMGPGPHPGSTAAVPAARPDGESAVPA